METTTAAPTQYIPKAEATRMMRADLKAAFPGVKFSVRLRSKGSSAVTVEWIDGPTEHAVNKVAKRYAGEGFDGMQDLRYSLYDTRTTETGETVKVHYLTSFVFTSREYSAAFVRATAAEWSKKYGFDISNLHVVEYGDGGSSWSGVEDHTGGRNCYYSLRAMLHERPAEGFE